MIIEWDGEEELRTLDISLHFVLFSGLGPFCDPNELRTLEFLSCNFS